MYINLNTYDKYNFTPVHVKKPVKRRINELCEKYDIRVSDFLIVLMSDEQHIAEIITKVKLKDIKNKPQRITYSY